MYDVYINKPTTKARLHTTDCIHYINRKKYNKNSFWKEFQTRKEAIEFMKKSGMKNILYECSRCPLKQKF